MAYHHLENGLHQRQSRPEATNHLAQNAKPLIDNGALQVAVAEGMGGRGRKALVPVEKLRRWIHLFAAGKHPVSEAEDVVMEMHASI